MRTFLCAAFLLPAILPFAAAQPRITAVVNGASFEATVSPGSFATITGQGLSTTTTVTPSASWPLELSGVSVTVGGQRAPLHYVSPTQINFQVPRATAAGPASVVVRVNAATSAAFSAAVAAATPGILVFGANQAVAALPDGSVVTPQNPVNPGGVITLYLTGIGPVDNSVADGEPTPASPLARATQAFSMTIGGRPAAVSFLGLTPGFVGLAQANVTIPDSLAPGNHPVILTVGGTRSNATAPMLAVDRPPRLESLSKSFGVPGTEVALQGVSLPAGGQVRSILLEFEDGAVVPAAPSTDGRLTFLVPFTPDGDAPSGYRTGNCAVSFYTGSATSNTVTFRIDPLPRPADPVGRFRTVVESLAAGSAQSLNAQKAIAEFSPLVSVVDPLSQSRTTALLALADQIAANGRATLPLDLAGPAEPGARSIEVTMRDLENFVAVIDQAEPAPAVSRLTPRAVSPRAGAQGPCLFDLPGYQYCTILAQRPDAYAEGMESGPLFRMFENAFTIGPQMYKGQRVLCTFNTASLSTFAIASHLLQYLNDRRLTCKLQPTKPVALTALPVPNPILAGSYEATGNRGTGITMRLEPFWTPEFTVDQVLESVYRETIYNAVPFPHQCARDLRDEFGRLAADMFNRMRDRMLESLRRISPEKSREVTLYKCDLENVQPSPASSQLAARRADKDDGAAYRWGIEGKLPGVATINLTPVWDHFLPELFNFGTPDPCFNVAGGFKPSLMGDFRPLNPCVLVTIAGPRKSVAVTSSQVFSYTSAAGPKPSSNHSPGIAVTDSAPYQRADASEGATSQLVVEQLSSTRYRVTQIVEAAPTSRKEVISTWNTVTLLLTNGPGAHKIRIQLKSDVSGSCQSMHVQFNGQARERLEDDGNNGCARNWEINGFSSATSTTSLDLGVFVLGGEGVSYGPGKGTVTTEFELLDDVAP